MFRNQCSSPPQAENWWAMLDILEMFLREPPVFCNIWQQGSSGLEYPLQDVFSLPRYRRDNFVTGNCELIFYHIQFQNVHFVAETWKKC